jgi:putative MFS transporter
METKTASVIEEGQMTPFLKKLTVFCSGGPFLDGFILVIIGTALVQLKPLLHLNSTWSGLIGAVALAGLFIGGGFFGYVTDLIGRRLMYILDLSVIVVVSILQMFVTNAWELLILRFIIGVAVGADYPIATSMLAEFAPRKLRGILLGVLQIMWFAGTVAADLVGYFLMPLSNGWMWMLGSAAIPAIILIAGRWGTPESPRWLMSKGRVEEARAVVKQVYGPEADVDDLDQATEPTQYSNLFRGDYLKRIIFCGGFWLCAVVPLFGIYTFGPDILAAFHLGAGRQALIGDILLSIVFTVGCAITLIGINKVGRRPLLIWGFVAMTIGMLILGLFPNAPLWVIITGFSIYALASGIPNDLLWIYPNELFPTEIRASAVGAATAISRIGAFIGTFLMPTMLVAFNVGPTMLIMTAVTFVGLLLTVWLAPETKDLSLREAAAVK